MPKTRSNGGAVIDLVLVAKTLGGLILALSAAMVLPMIWSLALGSEDWMAFMASIVILGLPSYALLRLKPRSALRSREALLVVSLGWLACAAASTLPFLLSGSLPNFIDALFESTSGLTTTGATVITSIEMQPVGLLFWRSFLHWLGGLGIIVIFIAVLPQVGLNVALFHAEVPGPQKQRLRPKLRETAKVLLWIYLGLTVAQIIALMLAGMSLYEAQIHTFGTVATGGFSNRTESIAAFNSPLIEAIIVVFMLAAGINFTLYYRTIFLGERSAMRTDRELRWYFGFLVIASTIVTLSIVGQTGVVDGLRRAVFQVVSIMTTTGYVTADFDKWPELARLVLLLLMFVGASAGSTGGAMKVSRWMILAKHLYRELLRVIHPTAVLPVTVGDEVIPERTIGQVTAFIGLYLGCFVFGSAYMAHLGLDLVSSVSSIAATLGNIGPGLGAVGATQDYSMIPASGKVLMTVMMLLGRLEIFTVLAVMTPAFWRR